MSTEKKITATLHEEIPLRDEEFKFFCDFIFKLAGILIDSSKKVMVQNRLNKRIKTLRLKDYQAYANFLKKEESEQGQFINALTTNKTNFFREAQHFDFLKNIYFKEVLSSKTRNNLYVWSAACSAGHEVYTLSLIYNEFIQHNAGLDYRILGTDIDTEMLATAERGIYKQELKAEIPPQYFMNNFHSVNVEGVPSFSVSDELRKKVKFRQFNLIDERQKIPLQFDIIFLRNVLIYFPREVIVKVIAKLVLHLNVGGYIFIGHSESISDMNEHLKTVAPAVYKKIK